MQILVFFISSHCVNPLTVLTRPGLAMRSGKRVRLYGLPQVQGTNPLLDM